MSKYSELLGHSWYILCEKHITYHVRGDGVVHGRAQSWSLGEGDCRVPCHWDHKSELHAVASLDRMDWSDDSLADFYSAWYPLIEA